MDGKNTVLVIDDDTALLKMAQELLAEQYTASLAKSGREAISLLEQGFLPDIILLIIFLPLCPLCSLVVKFFLNIGDQSSNCGSSLDGCCGGELTAAAGIYIPLYLRESIKGTYAPKNLQTGNTLYCFSICRFL
jgi:hypothetical protein